MKHRDPSIDTQIANYLKSGGCIIHLPAARSAPTLANTNGNLADQAKLKRYNELRAELGDNGIGISSLQKNKLRPEERNRINAELAQLVGSSADPTDEFRAGTPNRKPRQQAVSKAENCRIQHFMDDIAAAKTEINATTRKKVSKKRLFEHLVTKGLVPNGSVVSERTLRYFMEKHATSTDSATEANPTKPADKVGKSRSKEAAPE